ncbi:DUF1804 family protein [Candidatus Magnetaquicoccus inordinatus]|uniref:DUF1804 family protein n=1 Tax=Candidatus Magnetaquicoccus inordinatus TaxID=2496818 RepID=UPI00102C8FE1|nr:DUF1804 family protein [Candidatus Magnetaquicoccus inordinatus]
METNQQQQTSNWQQVANELWKEYLQAHRQAMTSLLQEGGDPLQRVESLAKLSLALDRTYRALEQGNDAISPLQIARQLLERQAVFIQDHFPRHLPAFLEILEPFGQSLDEHTFQTTATMPNN